MDSATRNSLASARSAYLLSAMHQPVEWNEWGQAAFDRAQAEDKPVLLDIGAVWCHWCHVMDRESYENADTAKIINDHFVAIKVDRDERPDVDARYQAAVSSISGQGGWPLTAFLTPDGRPFFGGTYFPPVDGHGRPSLRRVLLTMAEAFQERRGEVNESAESVIAAIEYNESFDGSANDPGAMLVDKILAAILKQFDGQNGGFGAQPKFPHAAAVDLLIDSASRVGAQADAARRAAMVTLEKMSKGGIYDHLAGGFHRYSVDERWVVPHFEKMSYDNSELLRNYVHAYQTFGEPECARIAWETMTWVNEGLSDRERGGFYASQDADFSLEDDGDYFTWTREEAAAVLTPEEMAVAGRFFDIGEIGDMPHNPLKNTLHVEISLAEVARAAGVSVDAAAEFVRGAQSKLYAARKQRPTPYVDKTIYVAWNGMMISAYLEAGWVLDDPSAVGFAVRSLERILEEAWDGSALGHVVAYGEGGNSGESVAGVLEDYLFTGHAALDAWEVTGEFRFFDAARALTDAAVKLFYDARKGGFFDTPPDSGDKLGALSTRRKPLQDAPTPAGNSVAAALLLRLAELTGRDDLRAKAKATLECFAGVVEHFGMHCASYGLALRRMLLPPVQVVVVGTDRAADALERTALDRYAVNKSVVRLRSLAVELPSLLAETLPRLPGQGGSFALVCSGFTCQPPAGSPEELKARLESVL